MAPAVVTIVYIQRRPLAIIRINTYNFIMEGEDWMKRKDWITILERNGFRLERKGKKHDIYTDGTHRESVSRQREIDEYLIKDIIARRGLK